MSNSGLKNCPECVEEIKLEAKVCRYCGTTFAVAQVGYCIRCHKVVAMSDLGVCAICGSRLIDTRLESWEIAGPTIGSEEAKPVAKPEATPIPPGVVPSAAPVSKPEETKPATEPAAADKPEETEPPIEPVPVAPPPAAAPPTPVAPPPASAPPVPEKPSAPTPPPGPPPGVTPVKPGEAAPVMKEPVAPPSPEKEAAPKPVQPAPGVPSDAVAERLAAFGRRETPAQPAPPSGSPVPPPPGRLPATPVQPTTPAAARPVTPTPLPPAKPVADTGPVKEKVVAEVPVEPVAGAGERLGIVPSLTQRIAYPLHQLAAIAVVAVWLLEKYRDSLDPEARFLSHSVVATYGNDEVLVIAWQIALVAVICALLIPLRVLPKGWFRQRKIEQEFTRDLKDQLGTPMIFQHKWYLQKMILAFTIWAIALGFFVAGIVRKTSVVPEIGGYVAVVALLTGFASAAILLASRTAVVAVDAQGKIKS